ncbi:hypothetical protein ACFWWT_04090 [Streptomyces sp. NPDC058676]|uniref:hypothetical protein n=1 Tax=Streptomyces sp. NPDC058676 TaxID=3346593 RepID=UPI0036560A5B
MALNIGELVGFIRADDSGMQRGLTDAELRMRGFQRDTEGRLRTLNGRFANSGELAALGLRQGTDEGNRLGLSLGRVSGMAGGLLGVAGSVGRIAAMLGAAAPAAAGLVATLANIAPAAGVAATGIVAVQLATNAVKIGMAGVSDAVSAALDPEKAAEFEKALAKLSPNAKSFVLELKGMSKEFDTLKKDVQDALFERLDEVLRGMGEHTLPILKNGLTNAAGAVNLMARNVGNAAIGLSKSGTLGSAISSANIGLFNLSRIPSQIVVALVQVASAAGPSFERLTAAAGSAFDRISERISDAFESGRMQEAIEGAIDLIGELAEVGANIGSILGSIFKAAQTSGGGFIGTLQEITGALADAFESPAVQEGLQALFQTMATLAKTAAPLLGQALAVIAPIFAELGPPVQTLIRSLGDALSPIIEALGPVLLAAAGAVGALVEAAAPLLPVAGQLVASLLPALTPLLEAAQVVFEALAPVVADVATILQDTLSPILAELPGIIEPLAELLAAQLVVYLELLGEILLEVGPSLVILGQAAADLLVALAPLIEVLAQVTAELLQGLLPTLTPLIGLVGQLAAIFATGLAAIITGVVIPVVQILTELLRGDFSGAWQSAKDAVANAVKWIKAASDRLGPIVAAAVASAISWLRGMPGRANSALYSLAGYLRQRANDAGAQMVAATRQKIADAVASVRGLPGRARAALGNLSGVLSAAGRSLIAGFVNGIMSKIGEVRNAASSVVSAARDFFPFSPAREGPFSGRGYTLYSGRALIQGFQTGIRDQLPALRAQLQGLNGEVPGVAMAGFGAAPAAGLAAAGGTQTVRVVVDGPESLTRVIRAIVIDKGGGDVQRAFGRG